MMSRCIITEKLRQSIRELCVSTFSNYKCKEFDGIICIQVEPTSPGSSIYPQHNLQQQQHIVIKLRDPSDYLSTGTEMVTSLQRLEPSQTTREECHKFKVDMRQYPLCRYMNSCPPSGNNKRPTSERSIYEDGAVENVISKRSRSRRTCRNSNQMLAMDDLRVTYLRMEASCIPSADSSDWTPMNVRELACKINNSSSTCGSILETMECSRRTWNTANNNIKRCGICLEEYRTVVAILEHQRYAHGLEDSFSCATCSTFYPSRSSFLSHRRLYHRDVTLQCWCDVCDVSFTYVEYKQHERECDKAVERNIGSKFSEVLRNEHVSHCRDSENEQISSTRHGPSAYPSLTRAEDDMLSKSSCLERSSPDDFVRNDVERKFNESCAKNGSCPKEGDQANCIGNVTASNDTTSGENPAFSVMTSATSYRCQLCPSKSFGQFNAFEKHCFARHSRLVCPYCSLSFANKRNVERHVRRHTGETPYTCGQCYSRFYRDDDLRRHHRVKHHTVPFTVTQGHLTDSSDILLSSRSVCE